MGCRECLKVICSMSARDPSSSFDIGTRLVGRVLPSPSSHKSFPPLRVLSSNDETAGREARRAQPLHFTILAGKLELKCNISSESVSWAMLLSSTDRREVTRTTTKVGYMACEPMMSETVGSYDGITHDQWGTVEPTCIHEERPRCPEVCHGAIPSLHAKFSPHRGEVRNMYHLLPTEPNRPPLIRL